MKFIDKLEVKYKSEDFYEDKEKRSRVFKAINIGNIYLSIQASYGHYCKPRYTLEPRLYDKWEIAIWNEEEWLNPRQDEYFNDFDRLDKLIDVYETGDGAIGVYVPTNLIEDLLDYVKGEEGK